MDLDGGARDALRGDRVRVCCHAWCLLAVSTFSEPYLHEWVNRSGWYSRARHDHDVPPAQHTLNSLFGTVAINRSGGGARVSNEQA